MEPCKYKELSYDVVVIGGGLSGICAAIAASRHGAKTAIIQARPMFGGNASSEIRMHIVGASCHLSKHNVSETGILEEILLENKWRNPSQCYSVWDTVLWEKVHFQEGLDAYLNTCLNDVTTQNGKITTARCYQETTEMTYDFKAKVFIDATGHATLGFMAHASFRYGSEAKREFNEKDAPEEANLATMGDSLLFQAVLRDHPVKFIKPAWAYTYSEEDLKYRTHVNETSAFADQGVKTSFSSGEAKTLPDFSRVDSGYWWIELSSERGDIISDGEKIRDELLKSVYGVWDHLKNQGNHGCDNYDLDWVGIVPGHRESRRLEGDYLLNENDVYENRVFPDAVAYGGWPMDEHTKNGLKDTDKRPSRILNFDGIYTIPYRCYYSKNISNMMMAGRDISATKLAFGTTRVMGTCAVGGQAAGTAAALAVKYGITPREVASHMKELQKQLMEDDCYLPGISYENPEDKAKDAVVTASSFRKGCEPALVTNGHMRKEKEEENCWESLPLCGDGQSLTLSFKKPVTIKSLRIVFDPNLSQEIMPSLSLTVRERQVKWMPLELVRDFQVKFTSRRKTITCVDVKDNHQRLVSIDPGTPSPIDEITITVNKTYGYPAARVFEVMVL